MKKALALDKHLSTAINNFHNEIVDRKKFLIWSIIQTFEKKLTEVQKPFLLVTIVGQKKETLGEAIANLLFDDNERYFIKKQAPISLEEIYVNIPMVEITILEQVTFAEIREWFRDIGKQIHIELEAQEKTEGNLRVKIKTLWS